MALTSRAIRSLAVALCAGLVVVTANFYSAPAWAGTLERPGDRVDMKRAPLAAPYATTSAVNGPRHRRRPDNMRPKAPKGFRVRKFAEGLITPRNMAIAENGDVLVVETSRGRVTVLRDTDDNGTADEKYHITTGLKSPYGIALRKPYLYVADLRGVWRYQYIAGRNSVEGRPRQITEDGALGDDRGHWTRNIVLDPNGADFFVAIGSEGNVGEEAAPRATIQKFEAGGRNQTTFASGLRNPVGLAIQPATGHLYTVVNERDGLGDDLVPDYLTKVEEGDFFGWPYSYLGSNPDPDFGDRRPDLIETAKMPDVLFRAHSAPLGLAFYTGTQFPEVYHGDAFVTLHGSWNSSEPRGYTVARVLFQDGKPTGTYEVFLTGFLTNADGRPEIYGRPTGIVVAWDGALLVSDEAEGVIWRVSYERY
ncbi:MAG: PQQ-dependent sugar dehydrogenase [Rhodospirillales bacterium]|nr:PQQ-dependent sugar dehydrogenase [Rhodospirillales bacterium]